MGSKAAYISGNAVYLRGMTEEQIIAGCKRGDRRAQKALYDLYSPRIYGVCKRYMKAPQAAEDVFSECMYKVLTKIHTYSGSGSLYGWMKRIAVNEALMKLRKKRLQYTDIEDVAYKIEDEERIEQTLYVQDIKELMERLPDGYRTILNLYIIEGYKHREIAELLGISINTSKSQLILAKRRMREFLAEAGHPRAQKDT